MNWTTGFLLATVVALSACAAERPIVDYAQFAKADPRLRPYRIGVADSVRVTVWKDPSLSTEAPVRPDGTLTVPLIGDVAAAGRTADEVREELTRRLSAYVKDAIVTVAVVEVNSYRFTVSGNVERPGMFTERSYVTVSEAVALAGGPNRFASPTDLVLIRPIVGREPTRIPIDLEAILSGAHPEQNLVVLSGDTVFVP